MKMKIHSAKEPGPYVLGISAGYHDSACSILRNDVLVAAVQEERFSRIKNDRSLPWRSFRYCLEAAGITISELDCVAFYEDPTLKLGRQVWMGWNRNASSGRKEKILDRVGEYGILERIRSQLGWDGRIEVVDHHLSHAASAYYFSGFDEAAILTVDGVGDWPTTTYAWAKQSDIQRLDQVDFPHSLGFFYSAVTAYLGFEVNEGEYKVMGLAPYGQPIYADKLRRLIVSCAGAQYEIDLKYFSFLTEDSMYSDALCDLLGQPGRQPGSEIAQFHMDVAKSAQVVLEEVLLEKLRYLHGLVPVDNLCMAGGVALNVVANSRCLKEGPFKKLFVQPAAGDAGGALGAAAVALVRISGHAPKRAQMTHAYFGPANDPAAVYRLLKGSSTVFKDFRGRQDDLIAFTVDRLVEGRVVGWSHGRCEFGPRSLGTRSILADPRDPQMRDRINALVKKREWFRPFAPAVLDTEAGKHFDLDHASPFMLETCQVTSPIDLPAITHVDGSARIQTVDADTNPRFAALIREFQRRTGCPILLNTSFNGRGEPIVCTPLDAIGCFVRCNLDVLVIEEFALERFTVPPSWDLLGQQTSAGAHSDGEVAHDVYTLL